MVNKVIRRVPTWVRLAPLDAMCAVWGSASSVSILLRVNASHALMFMPPWGRVLWAIALLVGCVCWLVGLSSTKLVDGHWTLTRVPALIFGLYLVSLAALLYGVIVLVVAGWGGVLPAASFLAIAGGTWLRRVDFSTRHRGEI